MSRGAAAPVGKERISQNGYHYTKTDSGWQLTHRMVAEELLGRSLRKDERVVFKNKNRLDLRPENLQIVKTKTDLDTLRKRRIDLLTRIEELQGQLADIDADIKHRELTGNDRL